MGKRDGEIHFGRGGAARCTAMILSLSSLVALLASAHALVAYRLRLRVEYPVKRRPESIEHRTRYSGLEPITVGMAGHEKSSPALGWTDGHTPCFASFEGK